MHKKISGRLAIEIVLFLSILVGGYALIGSRIFEDQNYTSYVALSGKNVKPSVTVSSSCKTHAYKGEAKVHGWYVSSGNEWLLNVSDEDIKNLPNYDGTDEFKTKNKQIKLVDVTPAVEKKLKSTSEKNPQVFTITGYVSRCESVPLASLDYKDGIFKKFLNS
jgi:hypothetical protein